MKSLSYIFFVAITFVLCTAFKSDGQSISQNSKVYVAMPDIGPSVTEFMLQNKFKIIQVFYTREIDPNESMILNVDAFTNAINKKIPDASASGYAAIDWEGKILTSLIFSPVNSSEYNNALKEYIKVLQLGKQLRPNIKWGFFPLPYPMPLNKNDIGKINTV